jgi:hypothetical protein
MTTTHADLQYATVDGQGLLYREYRAEHGGVPIVLLSRFQSRRCRPFGGTREGTSPWIAVGLR